MRAGSVQQHTSREHLQHGCCRSLSSSKARSSRRITPDCVSWPVPASCHRRADAVLVPPTKAVSEQTTTAPPQPLATKDEDTIAAIVTGSVAQGSVAIIRVSGTDAFKVASRVFRPSGKFKLGWEPKDRRVYYGTAVDGDERVLDEVLLISMHAPRSYTCENVIELHTHGGGVCVARVLQACIEAGARRARPGEFTLRAFLNGRLDLAQAEAVSTLLQARTAAAADSALAGLRGGVGALVSELRQKTIELLGEVEARIDFDEDMPSMDSDRLKKQVESLQAGIENALRTARQGNLLRQGLTVAIVGRPNVGKSSLLNAWTRTDRAIVTDVAGTTRDVLEAGLVVGGVPITLLDTAGIRESSDVVEKIGIERSRMAATNADIAIMVVDAQAGWTDADGEIFKALWGDGPGTSTCAVRGLSLLVVNKTDLAAPQPSTSQPSGHNNGTQAVPSSSNAGSQHDAQGAGSQAVASQPASHSSSSATAAGTTHQVEQQQRYDMPLPLLCKEVFQRVVYTSAQTGSGLSNLDKAMLELAGAPQLAAGGASWAVNERQAEALVRAHEAFMRVSESMSAGLPLDFWTIDLRSALLALGEVSGDEVTEEILDSVFSRFCIGK